MFGHIQRLGMSGPKRFHLLRYAFYVFESRDVEQRLALVHQRNIGASDDDAASRRLDLDFRFSEWIRDVAHHVVPLGAHIKRHDVMGYIADPFGEAEIEVKAPAGGIVIGRTNIPLVHEGEALFHVARFEDVKGVAQQVESFRTGHTETLYVAEHPPII